MAFINAILVGTDQQFTLNTDHITHALPTGMGTKVYFTSGESVHVQAGIAELTLDLLRSNPIPTQT